MPLVRRHTIALNFIHLRLILDTSMNRIAILVDGNNFYKGCQLNFNRTDVDFRKLGIKLCRAIDGELLRIYYYNAHVSKSIDPLGYQRQQKFFDNLRATPFITLKLGHLVYHRIRSDHATSSQYFPTEKGIDVQIAVDMIRLGLLKSCDGIILVSGDSDYVYAVRFAKDLGCNLHIATFPMGGSTELRNEGDGSVMMDHEFIHECFIRSAPYVRVDNASNIRSYGFPSPYRRYPEDETEIIDEDLIGENQNRPREEESLFGDGRANFKDDKSDEEDKLTSSNNSK